MDVNGQVAVVTGGASGLGGATARMLAETGAKVALFDLNQDLGEEVAKEIGGIFVSCDVTSADSVAAGLAEAAPSPMPEPEEAAPIDAPTAEAAPIDSFAEVVERAEATRAARLYHHLMEDVRLVAFKPGQITLRPLSNAPPDLAATLRGKLEEWTGQAWAVVIDGQAEGAPPLAEQQRRDRTAALAEAESHPLLDYLFRHLERPEFTCRFRWRQGSVALWDNRCTQHRALNDYPGQRRAMRRVLVAGDRPYHRGG